MHEPVAANEQIWWKQYSLKSLMIGVTVFCVVCALLWVPHVIAIACFGLLYGSERGVDDRDLAGTWLASGLRCGCDAPSLGWLFSSHCWS